MEKTQKYEIINGNDRNSKVVKKETKDGIGIGFMTDVSVKFMRVNQRDNTIIIMVYGDFEVTEDEDGFLFVKKGVEK